MSEAVHTVHIPGISPDGGRPYVIPIENEDVGKALAPLDHSGDGVLGGEDVSYDDVYQRIEERWLPSEYPSFSIQSLWVAETYLQALRSNGLDDSTVSMVVESFPVSLYLRNAVEIVDGLREIPYESKGINYNFVSDDWTMQVLPLIGNTQRYDDVIGSAALVFGDFAKRYDLIEERELLRKDIKTMQEGTLVDLRRVPDPFRAALASLSWMMSNVVDWMQYRNTLTQIRCDGDHCPEDDRSPWWSADFPFDKLCYQLDDSEITCFGYSYRSYVTYSNGIYSCSVTDQRTGEEEIWEGWPCSGDRDRIKQLMGFQEQPAPSMKEPAQEPSAHQIDHGSASPTSASHAAR